MPSSPLLPLPAGLEMATIETMDDLLGVQVVSTKVRASCPLCFCLAKRRHGRYTRVVADLPCAGLRVQLRLQMRTLARCRAEIPKSSKAKGVAKAEIPEEPLQPFLTSDGQPSSAHQTERYERSQHVMALHKQGMKVKNIAKRVGLGARTIQRWLASDDSPETSSHTRRHRSHFDTYTTYVQQRWDGGCHQIQQIWREIKAQGYPHSDRALRAHLEPLRVRERADIPAASSLDHVSAQEATWLFLCPLKDLDEKEQQELGAIRQASETAETIDQMAQGFVRIVRSHTQRRVP